MIKRAILLASLLSGAASIALADDAATPSAAPVPLPKCRASGHFFYPATAIRQSVQGRVLVEFGIDKDGRAVKPRVVTAEPDRILPQDALSHVKRFRCDVPLQWVLSGGTQRRLRASLVYEFAPGGVIQHFVPSDYPITITASLVQRPGR